MSFHGGGKFQVINSFSNSGRVSGRTQSRESSYRCSSCGLALESGLAHGDEAGCLEALRLEVRQLRKVTGDRVAKQAAPGRDRLAS